MTTKGWTLTDLATLKFPNPNTPVNYANKKSEFSFLNDFGLPSGWDYAHRKIAGDFDCYETPRRTTYDKNNLFTGKLGVITSFNIISDRFIQPVARKSKYVYALTKGTDNRGRHIVQAYLWERDNPGKTYWYKFRSARQAHTHLKRFGAAKRTRSDNA